MVVYSQDYIQKKLEKELEATFVSVEDMSDGCGAKFNAIVVSPKFEGVSLLQRHSWRIFCYYHYFSISMKRNLFSAIGKSIEGKLFGANLNDEKEVITSSLKMQWTPLKNLKLFLSKH